MERWLRLLLYFGSWTFLAVVTFILNVLNVNWKETHIVSGTLLVLVLSVIQSFVLEYPIQTIFCLLFGGHTRKVASSDGQHLTLILNYNLLATCEEDIDECMLNMYEAYMGNIGSNTASVLVSATKDSELRQYELIVRDHYRNLIFDQLYQEGLLFSYGNLKGIDNVRLRFVWNNFQHIDNDEFRTIYLYQICTNFVNDFMVIHRISSVLRKCGQYQDLMLLSEGETEAYTYCDSQFYSSAARKQGEPLFHYSEDVRNIEGRNFSYTLVLDSDTRVGKAIAFNLLDIAAANPESGIIQPAIFLDCINKTDTIFMHLESMRQAINEPLTNSMAEILEQSSFFGKGLISNKVYIDKILGSRDNLIERIPIDVLSHDTFEASILRPLYVGNIHLQEMPSYNYVTWSIRERRWNKGEILLAIYFFHNIFGKPMRFLQKKFQKSKFIETKLRTATKLDLVSSFVAHSALRQMFMKPVLLLFVVIHLFTSLTYPNAPVAVIMFFVVIFPKFATCNKRNFKYVCIESIASVLQFTPEAITGSVRIIRAFKAILFNNTQWKPQRAVEIEFQQSNPFVSAFRNLWGYSVFAALIGTLAVIFVDGSHLFLFMTGCVFVLPLYTGITSLPLGFASKYRPTVDVAVTLASKTYTENTQISGYINNDDTFFAKSYVDVSNEVFENETIPKIPVPYFPRILPRTENTILNDFSMCLNNRPDLDLSNELPEVSTC